MGYLPDYTTEGLLPMGRWSTTIDQIYETYVSGQANPRPKLWEEWLICNDGIRAIFGHVVMCWLSGSFFTTKETPGDIDCTYFISATQIDQTTFEENAQLITSAIRAENLHIDLYFCPYEPISCPKDIGTTPYFSYRGYWDDWWQRHRTKTIPPKPKPEDVYPRRGYLEVILDGYQ